MEIIKERQEPIDYTQTKQAAQEELKKAEVPTSRIFSLRDLKECVGDSVPGKPAIHATLFGIAKPIPRACCLKAKRVGIVSG
jgi:hypothetical protein